MCGTCWELPTLLACAPTRLPAGGLSSTSYEQLYAALQIPLYTMSRLGLGLPLDTIPEDPLVVPVRLTTRMDENKQLLPAYMTILDHLRAWGTRRAACTPLPVLCGVELLVSG